LYKNEKVHLHTSQSERSLPVPFVQILEENIRTVKLSTPDYRDMDPGQAMEDFRRRRENYISVYEPVDVKDGPHIKIVNSRQFMGTYSKDSSVDRFCVQSSHVNADQLSFEYSRLSPP
jgi:6-phosphofructo-2-kinase